MKPTTASNLLRTAWLAFWAFAFFVALGVDATEKRIGPPPKTQEQSQTGGDQYQWQTQTDSTEVSNNQVVESIGVELTGGTTTVTETHDYDFPASSAYAPPVPNTDPLIRCIGLAWSTRDQSTALGPCWKDRDIYALRRMESLARAGAYAPAAKAYCSRRLHWRDYGSRETCEIEHAAVVRHSYRALESSAAASRLSANPPVVVNVGTPSTVEGVAQQACPLDDDAAVLRLAGKDSETYLCRTVEEIVIE